MRHVCVHGAKCGTDAVVVERCEPAGGPGGLVGVGAQHVDEQDLCEVVQDQGTAGGDALDSSASGPMRTAPFAALTHNDFAARGVAESSLATA
ncbi:hypothetical protein [Streptomyces sp. RTd22]|uniref:hypothetical protein n=1 Tax=Streptomyces sp. RTd22 TaxID=1841249 RepID=UPI0007C5B628|nr:hypothetical protein [Streptomyces sp. RTd22]